MTRNRLLLILGTLITIGGITASIVSSPASPNAQQSPPEISTQDADTTFTLKTEQNTVLVPVVVRNSKGEAIDDLRKEDFRVFDRGKPQTIVSLTIEKPSTAAKAPSAVSLNEKPEKQRGGEAAASAVEVAADQYVALFFDDITSSEAELAPTREAAAHYLSASVLPNERIGLFTASGRKQVDFTSNLAAIQSGLANLHSHQDTSFNSIPPYLAHILVEHDQGPSNPYAKCESGNTDLNCIAGAATLLADARPSIEFSNTLTARILSGLQSTIHQMSTLPGQRTLVIVSPGFQTFSISWLSQLEKIVDSAVLAHIVINALDARGVYGDVTLTDDLFNSQLLNQNELAAALIGLAPVLREGARRQVDAMREFAHDTGGIFFENSNDFLAGIRQTTGVPEVLYLLSFSPQNLKHDGAFHDLKVSLVSSHGLSLQARHGYFAPPKSEDLAAQEKENLRDAVFSLDETHSLPVEVHTQFFMTSETDARVTVLTHIDLHALRFRKDAGRNFDKLTLVTVLFDQDGHEVDAQKKVLAFQTHDAVLEKYLQSGITLDGQFSVKPGKYRVRTVLEESESGQLASLNHTFEIPY